MMLKRFILLLFASSSLTVTSGCASMPDSYSQINVNLPRGAEISVETVKNAVLPELTIDQNSDRILELTIYEYSAGKEKITYTANDTISYTTENGYIKVLCSIRQNGQLNKAFFIEATGQNEKEIITSFKAEFQKHF